MPSSHTTNKEVMKQNIQYPIGHLIIPMLNGYVVNMLLSHFISWHDDIIHSSYEVVSLLPFLCEKHICILFLIKHPILIECINIKWYHMKQVYDCI